MLDFLRRCTQVLSERSAHFFPLLVAHRYMGWALFDCASAVRSTVLACLCAIYKSNASQIAVLSSFTTRFEVTSAHVCCLQRCLKRSDVGGAVSIVATECSSYFYPAAM